MKTISLITDILYSPIGVYKKFISGIDGERMRNETKTALMICVVIFMMIIMAVIFI